MATHSSIFSWIIPGTEEPGGLPSMGSPRVAHDWCDLAAAAYIIKQIEPLLSDSLKYLHFYSEMQTEQNY